MHSLKLFLPPFRHIGYVLWGPRPIIFSHTNLLLHKVWEINYYSSHNCLPVCKSDFVQLRALTYGASPDILGMRDMLQFLMDNLDCSKEEASIIYSQNCDFLVNNLSKIKQAVLVLSNFGITKVTVREHFWTVFLEKDQLEARLQLLKRWSFHNINNGISILQLSYDKLQKCTAFYEQDSVFINGNNRITYFALFVQCHEKEACELFMKYKFMLKIKVTYLKDILEILKDHQVEWRDVMRDPWVFRYSPAFLSRRARRLAEMGAREKCGQIMPWMLRSTVSTLDRYFELLDENLAALGSYSDVRELLGRELSLSDAEVADMVVRHPPLARLRCAKARDMVRFLRANGFTSRTIYLVPRALCHKRETLVARMAELKKIGASLLSLQNMCRNKKDYAALVNRMSTPLNHVRKLAVAHPHHSLNLTPLTIHCCGKQSRVRFFKRPVVNKDNFVSLFIIIILL